MLHIVTTNSVLNDFIDQIQEVGRPMAKMLSRKGEQER